MTTDNVTASAPVHQLVGQIRELMARGTPGPWHDSHMEWDESGRVIMAGGRDRIKVNWNGGTWRKQCEADAALTATSVNAMPALLAIVEAAADVIESRYHPQYNMAEKLDALECATIDLRTALSSLPNAKADLAGGGEP